MSDDLAAFEAVDDEKLAGEVELSSSLPGRSCIWRSVERVALQSHDGTRQPLEVFKCHMNVPVLAP
jgi:hypothetical protein